MKQSAASLLRALRTLTTSSPSFTLTALSLSTTTMGRLGEWLFHFFPRFLSTTPSNDDGFDDCWPGPACFASSLWCYGEETPTRKNPTFLHYWTRSALENTIFGRLDVSGTVSSLARLSINAHYSPEKTAIDLLRRDVLSHCSSSD